MKLEHYSDLFSDMLKPMSLSKPRENSYTKNKLPFFDFISKHRVLVSKPVLETATNIR